MPRKGLPASVFSSSPCHLRCLAVLTAAWGSQGFRATVPHRHLVSAVDATSSSSWRGELGGVDGHVNRRGPQTAVGAHVVGFFHGHRRRPLSTGGARLGCASADSTAAGDSGDAAAAATSVEVAERKWLGNGPDPMANTGKILPGTSASLAAVANGGEKGHGVPTEEMWLNGPFKAPLPPGPLVSGRQGRCKKPSRFVRPSRGGWRKLIEYHRFRTGSICRCDGRMCPTPITEGSTKPH